MIDHREIRGPEFLVIDEVVGDGKPESGGRYFIGRDTADAPLQWGMPFKATDRVQARLIELGLARADGRGRLIIDRTACISVHQQILDDVHGGLLGRLLRKFILRSDPSKPGEGIKPYGIYSELGIGNFAYCLTKALADKGLISVHQVGRVGLETEIVVRDEAREVVGKSESLRSLWTPLAWIKEGLSSGVSQLIALGVVAAGTGLVAVLVSRGCSSEKNNPSTLPASTRSS